MKNTKTIKQKLKITEIKIYKCSDGDTFDDYDKAVSHETELTTINKKSNTKNKKVKHLLKLVKYYDGGYVYVDINQIRDVAQLPAGLCRFGTSKRECRTSEITTIRGDTIDVLEDADEIMELMYQASQCKKDFAIFSSKMAEQYNIEDDENNDDDDWYSKRMKKWAEENGLNISCD